MRIVPLLLLCSLFSLPAFAATETFKNVSVIDVKCHTKFAKDADTHPRACAIKCATSGYGIFTQDGKYLKFDQKGNKEVLAELKSSDQKDHLRVDVTGDVEGNTIKVESVTLL
ncbi:MAG TPA: hypothetical protein VLV88_02530 [Terriglobales bacterium]|nr:hypothetical protein [Terriglobales bacterium]